MSVSGTLVVLTGAGISAESGLATFRASNDALSLRYMSAAAGLWCGHRVEDVATPEGFRRNPSLVHAFYNMRRAQLKEVQPNAAHHALAELAEKWPGRFLLVTQNVDDLHFRALSGRSARDGFVLLPMHGELKKIRCELCDEITEWEEPLSTVDCCHSCGKDGYLRPHIVWFGEMPLRLELIDHYLSDCDLFLSIGTSGNVYPAAGFVHRVREGGRGRCVELNLEPSLGCSLFHEGIYGPATEIVPAYVRKLLAESG